MIPRRARHGAHRVGQREQLVVDGVVHRPRQVSGGAAVKVDEIGRPRHR